MSKRILIVEDDPALAKVLKDNLQYEGSDVAHAADGASALNALKGWNPDLVVLDVMLPDADGFELCGVLRQSGRIPVIMLTARGQKADKLRGLDLGADDYVTKPFDLEEFLARVRAVLRRARPPVERLVLGRVTIDVVAQHATKGTRPLHLTHREYALLQFLAERQSRFVSRRELLREVWGYLDVPTTRSVDHAIARLRKKIEAHGTGATRLSLRQLATTAANVKCHTSRRETCRGAWRPVIGRASSSEVDDAAR